MSLSKQEILDLLKEIKIAKILSFKKNENSDHLLVVQIDDGESQKQIVTGANNFKEGDLVPYLGIGKTVPGFLIFNNEKVILQEKPLRGYTSAGMILAEDEIGLSKDHEGIMIIGSSKLQNINPGDSMLQILNQEELDRIMRNAGVIEITPALQEKINLIKSGLDEVIGETDLTKLLSTGTSLEHYIGFEISGLVHLGTGLSSMIKIRDFQNAGVNCRIFLADWHTWINDKLGGDHDLIKRVANEYFKPAMKVSAQIVGADPSKIQFINGSDLYHENDRYWQTVVEISKNLTLARVLKSTTIMGRQEKENMVFAYLIYPPMQAADIHEMGVNIAHAGMDQRKIHVIEREVALSLKINPLKDNNGNNIKPVALHHHLLSGLQAPHTWPIPEGQEKETVRTEMKMSKSIPGSAIFIHDSEVEIRDKIRKAFCPEKEVDFNPILDWTKYLIFPVLHEVTINRDERFGGTFTVKDFEELADRYKAGDLYPLDLKNNIADILVDMLKPARERFSDKDSQELIELIKNIKKTR